MFRAISFLKSILQKAYIAPLAFCAIAPHAAFGVSRTIYFSQSARNLTTEGLGNTARGNCRITITNPSAQSQTYLLTVSVVASGTAAASGNATLTSATGGGSCGGSPGAYSCGTHTLAAGGNHTYIFSYPIYPTRPTIITGIQYEACSGSIVANDTTNPGFLLASGALLTFSEGGNMQTVNSTGGTFTFAGQAIYSQLPITINRGKPF